MTTQSAMICGVHKSGYCNTNSTSHTIVYAVCEADTLDSARASKKINAIIILITSEFIIYTLCGIHFN